MDIRIERSCKRRKTITLQVKEGAVIARIPQRISDRYVYDLIEARRDWIQTQIQKQQSRPPLPMPKTHWLSGEAVPFLGEPYLLSCNYDAQALKAWYLEQAKIVLVERTDYFATEMRLRPKQVIVKNQKTRWGSCSADNVIRYNWKIIQAPLDLVDYLIVHELAHIQHKNHGPHFWSKVSQFIENPLQCRKALHHFGHNLAFDLG